AGHGQLTLVISQTSRGAMLAVSSVMPGYSSRMRAVWLSVPEEFLAERRRLGHDKLDEVWDGVLHMTPTPLSKHARRCTDLVVALHPITHRRGLLVWSDGTGLYGPQGSKDNYRVPDLSVSRPDQVSRRGLESAELVVEMLSEHDE